MPGQGVRVKCRACLKALQGFAQACAGLLRKKQSAYAIVHCFQRPTPPVGYNRASGSLGFYRSHAEIFLSGEQKRPATPVQGLGLAIAHPANKFNARACHTLQFFPLLSVARHNKPPVHCGAGFNGNIHPFIAG